MFDLILRVLDLILRMFDLILRMFDLILRVLNYIVTISFGCVLYCGCFNLLCNVWVCVGVGAFVICVLVLWLF